MPESEPRTVSRRALRQQLESLQAAGIRHLPKGTALAPAATSTEAPPSAELQAPAPSEVTPSVRGPVVRAPVADQAATDPTGPQITEAPSPTTSMTISSARTLKVLQKEVCECTACDELASERTQTVFGVGDPKAQICFMGEAPGADEDRLGEPFVGRAGKLLTKIIEACNLTREEVYILNVLKCRPPGNRNPSPEESRNCRRFLSRQLELVDPEYICCLGAVAAQNFLETDTPIGKLRGKVHEHAGRKVICTYHPAYLLRNPSAKKSTWEDMKLLMKQVGVEL